MEDRVALIGIILESEDSIDKVNSLLSEYRKHIIGRMGIPYDKKELNIISVVLDAPQDAISALSGKLGALKGVSTKTIYRTIERRDY
ncbi:MAG: TM1266 family iron-only hydrogenase system putative regulator [Anaerovoracaceae bacterium]|nr:iron-only hydrogenase system regulator [Clostridiales bacterium]